VTEFQNPDKKEKFIVESGWSIAAKIQELISALFILRIFEMLREISYILQISHWKKSK
jgi:hypothetical protein